MVGRLPGFVPFLTSHWKETIWSLTMPRHEDGTGSFVKILLGCITEGIYQGDVISDLSEEGPAALVCVAV